MIAVLLLAAATPSFQNVAALDRAVAAFTGRGIGDEGGARAGIDPRLRLQTCPTVALSWRTAAHDAVVVACSGPDWRLFVPVRTPPGLVAAPPPTATAAIARPAKVDPVIRRGDPVVIEAGSNGFAISREGVAMADAAPGARFMVRVDDGKALVQAMALASGRATLPGWTE
jgi:flagella basal body P-ring formation protein FlgA